MAILLALTFLEMEALMNSILSTLLLYSLSKDKRIMNISRQKVDYREYLIRREFFLEAKTYGEQLCSPLEKPRRLYVILNPVAGNSKCKKSFLKNAAPIFYLAGIDVTYIQTDYEGHAKTLVNYFDPSVDGIVVAGGDGTLQEVVTGLFRQKNNEAISSLPVGVVPLGSRSNSTYRNIFGSDVVNVKAICNATLAIVKGNIKEVSVMEVKTDKKAVFALSNIHLGVNQEVREKIDAGKYWLLGPLKKYFAFAWRTTKNWPPSYVIDLSSSSLRAIKTATNSSEIIPTSVNRLTVSCQDGNECSYQICYSNNNLIDNRLNKQADSTGLPLINCSINGSHLLNFVLCENENNVIGFSLYLKENGENNQQPHFIIQKTTADESRQDFMNFGWQWVRNDFRYTPSETCESLTCTEVTINPPENEDLSYGIDGEVFDARLIQVSVYPKKINMFCSSSGKDHDM